MAPTKTSDYTPARTEHPNAEKAGKMAFNTTLSRL